MLNLLEGFHPGTLEVITGPMKSGKTRAVVFRLDKLQYNVHVPYIVFKPRIDDRFEPGKIVSRAGDKWDSVLIDAEYPNQIYDELSTAQKEVKFIAIDEAQFFDFSLTDVVRELIKQDKNVLVSGLDTDFRGEPFGPMAKLLCMADNVSKLIAMCSYTNCGADARWTQRLIDGEPAPYDSPLILVGDQEYEPRCTKHHYVPR